MKKTLYILLVSILFFTTITNVNALSVSRNGDGGDSGVSSYTVTGDGKTYTGYCIDATHVAGGDGYKILEEYSNTAYAKGMYAIASSTIASSTSKNDVESRSIAFRTFTFAAKKAKNEKADAKKSQKYLNRDLYLQSIKWLADYSALADKAFGYNCHGNNNEKACYSNIIKYSGVYNYSGVENMGNGYKAFDGNQVYSMYDEGNGDPTIVNAEKLFKNALEAASAFNGDASSSSATTPEEAKLKKEGNPYDDPQIAGVKYYTYTVTIGQNESLKNIQLICENCDSNKKVQLESYKVGNGEKQNVTNSTISEISGSSTGKTKITFTVKVQLVNITYDCSDINFNISYDLKWPDNTNSTDNKNVTMYIIGKNESSYQRLVIFNDDSGNGDGTDQNKLPVPNSLTVNFCNDDGYCEYYQQEDIEDMTDEEFEQYTTDCCTDLNTLCESNNPAKDYYCDLYSTYCGKCDTEMDVKTECTYVDDEDAEFETGYVKSAIDGDGKDNIKFCLLALKKDEEGNSYQTEESKENNYCKIYCKEDFKFSFPKALSVNSGSYFHLDASISGTKSCYTSEIDTAKFVTDIATLNSKYSVHSSEYQSEYEKIVADYNSCINMDANYDCFDPKIEYSYDESYNSMVVEDNEFVKAGDVVVSNDETTKCNGTIDASYKCTSDDSSGVVTISKRVSGGIVPVTFNTTKYVKSTITKTGNYRTPSVFYTQRGTDIITKDESIENGVKIDGLPVEVKTEKGEHKFNLTIKNIGEYYDQSSCKNGRLIGDENSIYNSKNEGKTSAEYQCYYYVNCPECEFGCEGDLCEIDFCDGKDCEATCLGNGCAYDNEAGLSYVYRTVSLNSMNPTNRELGYNWDNEKGQATIDNIESGEKAGEKAYENPEYSFTLTPALISEIKEYNKSQLNNGGYADNSLTCQDDEYGNKNVNCESKFIKKLQSGEIGNSSNQLTVPAYEEKFTSWLDSDYCNGACTITKRSGIGPSWK